MHKPPTEDSSTLKYPEPAEQAAEFMRLALPQLSHHHLAVNPVNYAVLYEHVSGRNQALSGALEKTLSQAGDDREVVAQQLFDHYVLNCNEQLIDRLRGELLHITAETFGWLMDASDQACNSEQTLENYASQLTESNSLEEMLGIVAEVISETRKVAAESRRLSSELRLASTEVDRLREDLETARKEASTDPLTGLLNRRTFDERLAEAVIPQADKWLQVALLLIDVDHFKQVNDRHGHLIGDKVLQGVAETIHATVKGGDDLARVGGEEFGVLLHDTPLAGAVSLAERIRENVAKLKLRRKDTGEALSQVTVSIGIAAYHHGESITSFVSRCDYGLYRAKHAGRNRLMIAD